MGRNAKHRANRREDLPRYIASSTFGLVDTQDFKGCQVIKWNFVEDQPECLVDHESKQVHFNKKFLRPDLSPEDVERIGNEMGGPVTLSDAHWTNF
jgi:hypothetical protein